MRTLSLNINIGKEREYSMRGRLVKLLKESVHIERANKFIIAWYHHDSLTPPLLSALKIWRVCLSNCFMGGDTTIVMLWAKERALSWVENDVNGGITTDRPIISDDWEYDEVEVWPKKKKKFSFIMLYIVELWSAERPRGGRLKIIQMSLKLISFLIRDTHHKLTW